MLHCIAVRQHKYITKASLIACFLFWYTFTTAQSLSFNESTTSAYQQLLNLRFDEAQKLSATDAASVYVANLSRACELLLSEDPSLFDSYESYFEKSISILDEQTASNLFVRADLALYWSVVHLKFGHEFTAFLELRRAYQLALLCHKKYPQFIPVKKTLGLLQIAMSSVPEKYMWITDFLNMEGNLKEGVANLQYVVKSDTEFHPEATVLMALVYSYILQQPEKAIYQLEGADFAAATFAKASVYIKNAEAEKALAVLNALDTHIPSVNYFLGEVLLCKGDYKEAVEALQQYVRAFKGTNLIKDAHFKTGICYLFLNDPVKANDSFSKARITGSENTEADRYAARTLAGNEPINTKLYKIRFHIDGGYFKEAGKEIELITPADLPSKKEQAEFYYRKARLEHKINQPDAALLYYGQVIDMSGDSPWYFAPNACLQSGYIYLQKNNTAEAKKYFEKALTYKKHEYKNSIDSKAKSAIAQLTRK